MSRVAFVVLILFPSVAFAQQATKPKAHERDRVVAFKLGLGAGGCTSGWCEELNPSFGANIGGYYRLGKYIIAGLQLGIVTGDGNSSVVDSRENIIYTAQARVTYPFKVVSWLDPWAGLVIGGVYTSQGGTESTGQDYNWGMHGFVLGFGLGADAWIKNKVAIGIEFYLHKPWYNKVCITLEGEGETCGELTSDYKSSVGIMWYAGVTVSLNLNWLTGSKK